MKSGSLPSMTAVLSCKSYLFSLIPGMVGYGMAKAAIHQLVHSLGDKDSGMPPDSLAVAILP